jgi:hypothetical protein
MTNAEVEAMWHEAGDDAMASDPEGENVPRGTTWVTRRGIKVDRMASAWLIRRFIDPEARFRFVPSTGYEPAPGERRFDMFDAEYTHEGESCTYETLVRRFGLARPALVALGEIVHDIDCKDGKYGRPEAPGIALVIDAIAQGDAGDEERLARGITLFDELHARFERTGGG